MSQPEAFTHYEAERYLGLASPHVASGTLGMQTNSPEIVSPDSPILAEHENPSAHVFAPAPSHSCRQAGAGPSDGYSTWPHEKPVPQTAVLSKAHGTQAHDSQVRRQ